MNSRGEEDPSDLIEFRTFGSTKGKIEEPEDLVLHEVAVNRLCH
jgi:hypothetical protein